MRKNDIQVIPAFFQKYIDLVPDVELMDALAEGGIRLFTDHINKLKKLGDETYEEGKWTVKQIVEHLMDTERIFQSRALRFARMDQTELPGYNQNGYARSARSNDFQLKNLLMQYIAIRGSTLAMYSNFNEDELQRTGTINGYEISVLAIGFIQIGHPMHHFEVLKERYFPLIS